jgi:ribonuclease-3
MGLPPPAYELVARSGPDHAPSFSVRVTLGERVAVATAGTLKRAQTAAARALLLSL